MQHASHADTNAHQGYNDDNKSIMYSNKIHYTCSLYIVNTGLPESL